MCVLWLLEVGIHKWKNRLLYGVKSTIAVCFFIQQQHDNMSIGGEDKAIGNVEECENMVEDCGDSEKEDVHSDCEATTEDNEGQGVDGHKHGRGGSIEVYYLLLYFISSL